MNRLRGSASAYCTVAVAILCARPARADDNDLRDQAAKAQRKATQFFRTQVAVQGGYVWRYSADLQRREGESKTGPTTAWVQPPGTPSIGMALLSVYESTGDAYYLEAARETALALVKGQLRSGGWDYRIEFDPSQRKRYAYRVDVGSEKGTNVTTLDDNTTQAALRFLIRVDRTLGFKDAAIHEAVEYALASLLKVQYLNGAWPQRYDRPPDPEKFPVKKASFPDSWPRAWPGAKYQTFYTLNDNSQVDVIDTLFEAAQVYDEEKFRTAACKGGDFLLLAQLPEPQPGWAQQYDADMHPAWARKFEPPAITGGESQGVMRALLQIYRATGDRKYLEPLPKALAYYRKVQLTDGRLARFYEMKTDKPLYFTKDYQLTYSDADMPTHYAFKVSSRLDAIAREYEQVKDLDPKALKKPERSARPEMSQRLIAQTKAVIAALDARGAWVEEGRLRYQGADDETKRIIECQTFIRNVSVLSAYLAASKLDR